jgi:outer membrane protein OmpA-like peptidoglycan-associated protein
MKKILFSITMLIVTVTGVFSQDVHSIYFLDEWSQRHTLNASFAPEYGYFSLPVFGGIQLGLSSNTGLSNYIYPVSPLDPLYSKNQFTTFLNSSVDGNQFLSTLPSMVNINQSMKLNLLSFGFYTARNSFWSFDIYMKENLDINMPKDYFRLAKMGMATQNNVYDLKNFGVDQTNIAQASLGYSRDINSKLRIGLNAKLLVGLSKVKLNYTQFDLTLGNNSYTMNATGDSYIMSNLVSVGLDANNNYDFSTVKVNSSGLKPAGYGAAFDIGFTYKPIKHITVAASLNDVGFMRWNATSIKKGIATSNVTYSGFSNVNVDSVDVNSQLDQLKSDATKLVKFKQTANTQDYTDNVPYTINASAEYSIFANDKHDIRLGMLYQSYNSNLVHNNELIGALTLKPLSWLAFSGTYDILTKDYNRYGVAINFSPSWINLYIASDYVTPKINHQFLPIDKFNLNISFGGSIVIGKPRDTDKDGVIDRWDKCPGTPLGVKVDKHGCPLDSDGDGVPDYLDKCPNTPKEAFGKVDEHGCPLDSDGDGVPDYLDKCPNTPAAAHGFINADGCPTDTDGDGVPDYLDKCPNTPAGITVDSIGCPLDSDGDGVPDYLDLCPGTPKQAKGFVDKNGCVLDSDGDGVPDYLDLCPNTPIEARGHVDKNGCPLDTDGDGVPDYLDKCPDTPKEAYGMVDEHGCPRDIDGDGIPDYLDKCPAVPGVASNNGCPEVKKEIKTLFLKALQGIQFESGKSVIKSTSYVILDQIAQVIIENPKFLIEVRGHTDNVGDPANNLLLSKNRAIAVRDYLISKGVNEKTITANGFGDKLPVATNKTAAGRKLNRRVEFNVTFE